MEFVFLHTFNVATVSIFIPEDDRRKAYGTTLLKAFKENVETLGLSLTTIGEGDKNSIPFFENLIKNKIIDSENVITNSKNNMEEVKKRLIKTIQHKINL